MFKLVVLSAIFAAVTAKPGVLLASPLTTYTSVVAPATTTITKQASSVIHPSPVVYSAPLAYTHFIKKRSPQLLAYNYAPTTYLGNYPATTLLSSPLIHTPAVVPAVTPLTYTAAHLIKKRSADFFLTPTTYGVATPYIASTYTATSPVISTPLIHSTPLISSPLTYSTHFIKKRSAPLLTTYVTPSSFSHQSRVDITNEAPVLKVSSFPTTLHSYPYIF